MASPPDVGKGASISAFVKTSEVALVRAGGKKVEPLVLHVAAGDCVQVNFHNARDPNRER